MLSKSGVSLRFPVLCYQSSYNRVEPAMEQETQQSMAPNLQYCRDYLYVTEMS